MTTRVSIPGRAGDFSFGAAQSGFSLSLQSGVPPLCECLTKCGWLHQVSNSRYPL
jgi:hypothetical protein